MIERVMIHFLDLNKDQFKTKVKNVLNKTRKNHIKKLIGVDLETLENFDITKQTHLIKQLNFVTKLDKTVLFELKCKVSYQKESIYVYYGNEFTKMYDKPVLNIAVYDMMYNKMMKSAKTIRGLCMSSKEKPISLVDSKAI